MRFKPRPYQEIMAEHVIKIKRCALHVPMGFGKTASVFLALNTLSLVERIKTLVVAPLRVAESVWPREVGKWDDFNHFNVVPILGSAMERTKALNTSADVHVINYDNLQWLCAQNSWKWNLVVADESTRLKSFRLRSGSKRAKELSKYAFSKCSRFIELTGTPAPNGLCDLWGQLWFLDGGQRLGKSFTAFMQRWFRPKHINSYEWIPMPHAQKEISERIADICLSFKVEDWFDIEKPIVNNISVMLPEKAMQMYKMFEKMMFLELEKNKEIEAFNAASLSIKSLQLANGAVYTDDQQNWEAVHDAKLNALEGVIEEAAGAPVLVAYHFKSDLARLRKRFPNGKELRDSKSIEAQWNKGEIPVLFIHPASGGHGLNLQDGGNIIAFFGLWWDFEHYSQVIERIGPVRQLQSGHPRPVYIYNLVAQGTIDEVVLKSRETKRTVHDLLIEAACRK